MTVGDFIFNYLYTKGVRHVFTISGGGNIHLIDALGRSKLSYICNHHEQASSTAAEGYARLTGNIGVSLVTTGPGGTNAITGVAGSWLDSIPTLTISGQVRRQVLGTPSGMRQLGPQEINIIDMVKPVTKYAVTVMEPNDILYHLEKAWYLARSGRPGPVWLDIPLDIQGAVVDEKKLRHFDPSEIKPDWDIDKKKLTNIVAKVLEKLSTSQRPVLYAGNGIRLADGYKEFQELARLLKIPILTSYVAYDLLPSDHPYFFGRAHSMGQRAANFIIQNCDFLLTIGARMDILTVGFTYKAFARKAYKVMVDIDRKETGKSILDIDLPVNHDAKLFMTEMLRQLTKNPLKTNINKWLTYGRTLNKRYPNVFKEASKGKAFVNYYHFIDTISDYLKPGEIIVESNGVGPLNCMYQAFRVKKDQRIILNLGCAQMGYGLPAAIGAAFAAKGKRVICFEGDGSLHLNVHELQVVKYHNLPIKFFVYVNDGYLSIRNTQIGLFGGKFVATNKASGVSFPDYEKIGKAYGMKVVKINNHKDMASGIRQALATKGPVLCTINAQRDFLLTPKLQTRKLPDGTLVSPTLEDMAPFLSEKEMKENMLIPLWDNRKV